MARSPDSRAYHRDLAPFESRPLWTGAGVLFFLTHFNRTVICSQIIEFVIIKEFYHVTDINA